MKIFSIVGARPQFIKLATLSKELNKNHKEYIVHTGQHYDYALSEKIFKDLGIKKPDFQLNISATNPNVLMYQMMIQLDTLFKKNKPDIIIVFGDTNSTLAGALAAKKLNIPIIHIEAGLRSFNPLMPEETNRIIVDKISSYLFTPTQNAVANLKKEGLEKLSFLTGDIMVDTLKNNIPIALKKSKILDRLYLNPKEFNLFTLHRQYNVDDVFVLKHLITEIGKLPETTIFPVHPRTKKNLPKNFKISKNIQLINPLGYLDFIALENYSKRIITDSGGIQKEAYLLKKPCITLRSETEWIETVNEKWNKLIHPKENNIAEKIFKFKPPKTQKKIFGENVTSKMMAVLNSIK